ncbi:MAG: Ig-like domain-containing protein [Acidimicrobiia bacterium]
MPTSVISIRLAARHLAGVALVTLLAGWAGDGLRLPRDGEPAELRMVSGDQQSAPVGDPVENPLIVEALDRAGRPVPGAVIVFEFVDPPSGAELAPANTETDAAGRASAEVKLGTPAGDQNVEARLDDPASDLSVRFRLTAIQPGGGGGGDGGGGDDDGDDRGEGGGGGDGGGGSDGPPDDGGGPDEDDGDDDKGKGKNGGKGEGEGDDNKGKGNDNGDDDEDDGDRDDDDDRDDD